MICPRCHRLTLQELVSGRRYCAAMGCGYDEEPSTIGPRDMTQAECAGLAHDNVVLNNALRLAADGMEKANAAMIDATRQRDEARRERDALRAALDFATQERNAAMEGTMRLVDASRSDAAMRDADLRRFAVAHTKLALIEYALHGSNDAAIADAGDAWLTQYLAQSHCTLPEGHEPPCVGVVGEVLAITGDVRSRCPKRDELGALDGRDATIAALTAERDREAVRAGRWEQDAGGNFGMFAIANGEREIAVRALRAIDEMFDDDKFDDDDEELTVAIGDIVTEALAQLDVIDAPAEKAKDE